MSDKEEFNEAGAPMGEQDFSVEEGSKEDSWQSDVPPEDDFHDPEGTTEELIEDEAVDGEEPAYEEAPADSGRGKKVLYAVLALIVLFVGGLFIVHLSKGTDPEPRLASYTMGSQAPTPMAAPEPAVAPTTGETDLATLYQASPEKQPSALGALAMPDKANETTGVSTEVMSLDQAPLPPPSLPPSAAATVAAPVVTQIESIPALPPEKPQAVDLPPVKPALPAPVAETIKEPVKAVPVMEASTVEMENRLKEMTDKIKMLETSLDQAMQKNAELVAKLETASAAASAPEAPRVEERKAVVEPKASAKIKTTVKKTGKAEKNLAPEPVRAEDPMLTSAGIVTDLLPEDQVNRHLKDGLNLEAPKAKEKVAKPSKKTARKAAKSKEKASSKDKAEGGMVLRAATPEAAWVSGSAHSSDLQRVTVGESLPGIGKVKEIRQSGDSWELVGTEGTLR